MLLSISRGGEIGRPARQARMLKLVDRHGLEPCTARCEGSSPSLGTIENFLDNILL